MTALELIIVLGIFSIISSVAFLNYGKFQDKVNIRNLSNEIALKVVEAQKSSINGKWHNSASSTWKPSYGVQFNISTPAQFSYFADLDNSGGCNGACNSVGGEVLAIISITSGNRIASIVPAGGSGCPATLSNFTVVFKRPNAAPLSLHSCNPTDVVVNLSSPQSLTARVRMYASGRIQIN